MSNMNEIWKSFQKTAVKAADATTKKAEQLWDRGKLSIQVSKLEMKQDEIQTTLGKMVYQAHRDGTDLPTEMELLLEQMDDLTEQIAVLKAKAEERKNRKPCPDCGFSCDKESLFCPACGKKL